MRCLAIGLGCLLSLAFASRAWADGAPAGAEVAQGAAPAQGAPAAEPSGTTTTDPAAADPAATSAPPAADPEAKPRPVPQRIPGAVTLDPPQQNQRVVPPYLRDARGNVQTTALFPFYFERRGPDSLERLIIPYYYRRGPKLDADVALGLVWSLRGPERNTFILPPFYTHRDHKDWGVGLFPLFGTGVFGGHHHTVIPPLLTWIDGDAKTRHTIIGPYYNWKSERAHWRGLFPLVWDKKDDVDRFTLVPPVFFRFADDEPRKATTVVPPFYFHRFKDETNWGLVPLVFHGDTPKLKSTTVPLALFHHARGPEEFRLVTPLLSFVENKKQGRLWITPIYQRRRGDRNLDGVGPIFFRTWDTRDASTGLVLAPIFWHFQDPANDSLVIAPLMGRWFHEGISSTWVIPLVGRYKSFERDEQTWWLFPTFHYAWTEDSWQFNIHPLVYRKESPERSHFAIAPFYYNFRHHEDKTHRFAIAPIYWDFKNFAKNKYSRTVFPFWWDFENGRKKTERRVAFPLYWDFKDGRRDKRTTHVFPLYTRWVRGDVDRQLVLNSFYEKKREPAGVRWQYHFAPFFSRGGIGDDRWWNVLYGLAGYDRRGEHRRIKVFWIPFQLD